MTELLSYILTANDIVTTDIINVIFSVTSDLDAVFPAKVAREQPGWDQIPLLDVQHMSVQDSLPYCIRVLIQLNSCHPQHHFRHIYLRQARDLRPDLLDPPDRPDL